MKVHLEISLYYSNPFIAMDSVNFDEINPFLDANGKEDLSVLGEWNMFIVRVGLWLRNCGLENVHIEDTEPSHDSISRNALVFASNNDKTVDMEILIKSIPSDHNYAVARDTDGNVYGIGWHNHIEMADVILISEELGMIDLCRSFTEVIISLRAIVRKIKGNI